MPEIIASRRGFLVGLAALIAAPAIVRVTSIMPVRSIVLARHPLYDSDAYQVDRLAFYGRSPCMDALPTLQEIQDRLVRALAVPDKYLLSARPRGQWIGEVRPLENWPGMKPNA